MLQRSSAPLAVRLCFVIAFLLLFSPAVQAEDNTINLDGTRVKMVVQARIRASGADQRSTANEFARINLVFNTLENYLIYLEKLGRIAPDTVVSMEYAPEGSTRDRPVDRWVVFDELLFNSVLSRLNAFLSERPGTKRNDLIQDRTALRNVRDQLPRHDDVVENSYRWKNFSDLMPAIEPDVDFAVLHAQRVVGLRPTDIGYSLVRLDASESAGIELASFSETVWDLTPSPDGTWVALTVGGELKLVNCINRQVVSVFEAKMYQLLDMAWAPRNHLLAGIVLDRRTGDRDIFLYNATTLQMLPIKLKEQGLNGNYQFAWPCWSPDGSRLIFTSGNDFSLIEVSTGKVYAGLFPTPNTITEIIWSPDSRSFAFVEILGQSRNKSEFDDRDFRGSILHRFRIPTDGAPFEETSQRYLSEQTIKLISFWSQDRLFFLEGRLRQQKVHSAFWDLSTTFAARLTPPPMSGATAATMTAGITRGGMEMRLDYCHVFRNLDGRFRNTYDAGRAGTNWLFTDRMVNIWFLGISPPEGAAQRIDSYSLRSQPYPFGDRNISFLSTRQANVNKTLCEFLASYNLRRVEFIDNSDRLFFLSNSRGPLSIWGGESANVGASVMAFPKPTDEGSESEGEETETAVVTGSSGDFVLPPPPPPPLDPGVKILDQATEAKPPVTMSTSDGVSSDFVLPPPPPLPGLSTPAATEKPPKKKKEKSASSSTPQVQETGDFVLPPPPSLPGFDKK